ncbi:MAG: hypothetical protein U5K30_05730 [Acidimicrobiales bacterium]|nr:hypothetical protein [Acidimicrobiales bacterium]
MPFTTNRPAERDRGRTAKRRPVVVVAVDGPWIGVRAVYGTNSARRRTGQSVRLQDPDGANLRKRSVVDLEMLWLARDDIGPLIGSLADVDRRRVLGS